MSEEKNRNYLRNIAIIAHVDHGKTTLVDAMFRQGGIYRQNQVVQDRAMDSDDQERERGITILAKNTSVRFGDYTFQIVDTPGHADFGGEVERALRMVDGVLLLVDAAEGPLPQTRFVLRKALELGLPSVVAINKIDRSDARPDEVLDEIYDLYIDLGANEEQLEFPVLYTVSRDGIATDDLSVPGKDLKPLVDAIVKTIPAPKDKTDEPFLMLVNQLAYDDYTGRMVVGRIINGFVRPNQTLSVVGEDGNSQNVRITGIYSFQGLQRITHDYAQSGDIVCLAGFDKVTIGDTICAVDHPVQLPRIKVDEPTVSMTFQVNDGPLAGRSGKFLTSRQLRQRLFKEAYVNVSIRVEDGESPDQFKVMGRGELQLAVLIESLRREGFELCVRSPQVVTREGPDGMEEPVERLVIDVPPEYMGAVSETLGRRHSVMIDQRQEGSRMRLEYRIPTRGLFGLRSQLLTLTRGTVLVHSVVDGWIPWTGPIVQRTFGAIVADRVGETTAYALFHLQPRGQLFIGANAEVYEGMIIGEHCRENDLNVNPVRPKKLTNLRAAGKDENCVLSPPRAMPLERAIEWIKDDEMVEVTPAIIRLRKRVLSGALRPRSMREDD